MWQFLLHLWAFPPEGVPLTSPAPPPGAPVPAPGFYDSAAVNSAYQWTAAASALLVLAIVLACYLLDRQSLSRAFVRRWWGSMGIAALVGAVVPLVMLYVLVPQHAMADSCSTNPLEFAALFPVGIALNRSLAGMVWTALAFTVVSLLLTRAAGWHPAAGGLFHNRGCPWPRVNPFGA